MLLDQDNTAPREHAAKYGTFIGVFVPTILMLFGVIIFLRLGWIVGQAGLISSLLVISFASLIALITTLSMASICTNMNIGKGGVYYIISRSLGLEIGSAIGIPLYVKQSLSIAFCVIGFAESLHGLLPFLPVTLIGIITLCVLTVLAYYSLSGALKVQLGIFAIIIASLLSLFLGHDTSFVPEYHQSTPSTTVSLGFWAVFSIFFPAMTGVESSVSLSGDLRNPEKSVPLGTISALLVAYCIYMIIPIFIVQHASLDSLLQDPLIMQHIAKVPALIILGIWGATISSALGGLLGAPRTMQALSDDGVLPALFGKTFGPRKDPRIATLTSFALALCGIYFGSINLIAPLLTMVCLICYGVLNFAAGIETLMAVPSWRPRFRIYSGISLAGALLCLIAMLMIDAGSALLAIAGVALIYLTMKRRKIKGSWHDIRYAILLFFSRALIYRIANKKNNPRSWRPHFLVVVKDLKTDAHPLLQFVQSLSQSKSFLSIAYAPNEKMDNEQNRSKAKREFVHHLHKQNIPAFVQILDRDSMWQGIESLMNHYGLGSLVPDTLVLLGNCDEGHCLDFAKTILRAHKLGYNIILLNENAGYLEKIALSQDIHVWWDEQHLQNSHFMLLLIYMLRSNRFFANTRIQLKSVVEKHLHSEKLTEFEELALRNRLDFNTELFEKTAEKDISGFPIEKTSHESGLIFLSLRPPVAEESAESYADHLKSIRERYALSPPTILALSTEFKLINDALN